MEDVKFCAIDVKEEIKKERERLQNKIINKEKVMPWMINWLLRDDEIHYIEEGDLCDVCGKKSQFYIRLDFLFEGYLSNIFICKNCLIKMFTTLENKIKER